MVGHSERAFRGRINAYRDLGMMPPADHPVRAWGDMPPTIGLDRLLASGDVQPVTAKPSLYIPTEADMPER